MMGVKPDGRIIFLVAYAVDTRYRRCVLTVDEGAELLRDMDAQYVLNFDGGSRTQILFEGREVMSRSYRGVDIPHSYVGSVLNVW